VWTLGPRREGVGAGAPPTAPRASGLATLALSFGAFAGLAVFAPFPLATVPSLLGKRLARAYGAWALLFAVVCHALTRAAESGEWPVGAGGASAEPSGDELEREYADVLGAGLGIKRSAAAHADVPPAAPVTRACRSLERGARRMAAAHLLVSAARPLLESASLYPAAMACRPAVAASLLVYVLALAVTSGTSWADGD
jgi:hypothetical protein